MYCPKCGAELYENDEFCSKCGEKIYVENINKRQPTKKEIIVIATVIFLMILMVAVGIISMVSKIPTLQKKLMCEDVYHTEFIVDDDIGAGWYSVNDDGLEIIITNEDINYGYGYCNNSKNNSKTFEYTIEDNNSLTINYCDSENAYSGESYVYEYANEEDKIGKSGTWYVDKGVLFIGSREFRCID